MLRFPSGFQFVAAIFLRSDRPAIRDGIRQGNHGDRDIHSSLLPAYYLLTMPLY